MANSINTAFIEDEETYANSLNHLISNWGKQNNIIFNVNHFVSGKTFFESHYLLFDLIFLDIELNDTNGLDIAKKLREQEYKGIIIFVTSHSEYVFEGYNVQAFNYLVKPFNKDNLFKTLASAVKLVEKKNYTFHTNKEILRIPFNQILYFTSNKHYVEIHVECTDNGLHKKIYEQRINLSDLEKNLPDYFYRCHRTTIINLHKIISIYNCCITLTDGSMHPISKKYVSSIHNAILDL